VSYYKTLLLRLCFFITTDFFAVKRSSPEPDIGVSKKFARLDDAEAVLPKSKNDFGTSGKFDHGVNESKLSFDFTTFVHTYFNTDLDK
jgi:hypothetical protein